MGELLLDDDSALLVDWAVDETLVVDSTCELEIGDEVEVGLCAVEDDETTDDEISEDVSEIVEDVLLDSTEELGIADDELLPVELLRLELLDDIAVEDEVVTEALRLLSVIVVR